MLKEGGVMKGSMTRFLFVATLVLLGGCSITSITPRESLTAASARANIVKYEKERLKSIRLQFVRYRDYKQLRDSVEATDDSFTHVVVEPSLAKLAKIKYSELGQFRWYYSWWNLVSPLVAFMMGPTITEYRDDNGTICFNSLDYINNEALYSLIPLWLIGVNLWRPRAETLFVESLEYMRRRALPPGDGGTAK